MHRFSFSVVAAAAAAAAVIYLISLSFRTIEDEREPLKTNLLPSPEQQQQQQQQHHGIKRWNRGNNTAYSAALGRRVVGWAGGVCGHSCVRFLFFFLISAASTRFDFAALRSVFYVDPPSNVERSPSPPPFSPSHPVRLKKLVFFNKNPELATLSVLQCNPYSRFKNDFFTANR